MERNSKHLRHAHYPQRNETLHPPRLDSVHISTHPHKKSKGTSRFATPNVSTSPVGEGSHSSDADSVTVWLPNDRERCQLVAQQGVSSSKDVQRVCGTNIGRAVVMPTDIPLRRANACLKTPKKATTAVLPHRVYRGIPSYEQLGSHDQPINRTSFSMPNGGHPQNESIPADAVGRARHRSTDISCDTFSFGDNENESDETAYDEQEKEGTADESSSVTSISGMDAFSSVDTYSIPLTHEGGQHSNTLTYVSQNASLRQKQGRVISDEVECLGSNVDIFPAAVQRSARRKDSRNRHRVRNTRQPTATEHIELANETKNHFYKQWSTAFKHVPHHFRGNLVTARTRGPRTGQRHVGSDPCNPGGLSGLGTEPPIDDALPSVGTTCKPGFGGHEAFVAAPVYATAFPKKSHSHEFDNIPVPNGDTLRNIAARSTNRYIVEGKDQDLHGLDAATRAGSVLEGSQSQHIGESDVHQQSNAIDSREYVRITNNLRHDTRISNVPIHKDHAHKLKQNPVTAGTKPPVVIMCQVPATGEALLNKPTPLRAPSRRSMIPRKAPRPPTTGFQRDDLKPTSRYYRYVSQFEDDQRIREARLDENSLRLYGTEQDSGCIHPSLALNDDANVSVADTSVADATVTGASVADVSAELHDDILHGKRRRRAQFTTVVVSQVSNLQLPLPSDTLSSETRLTRATPVYVSLTDSDGFFSARDSATDNPARQPSVNLRQSQLGESKSQHLEAWKRLATARIMKYFHFPSGLATLLNPASIGTHTCDWFWPLLTSDTLWSDACEKARALAPHGATVPRYVDDGRKFNSRGLLKRTVMLLSVITENLQQQSCNSSGYTLKNNLEHPRKMQEQRVLMIVVRDVLKLWVQGSFGTLDADLMRWTPPGILCPLKSLSYVATTKDTLEKCAETQRRHVDKLRWSQEYLERVASQYNLTSLTPASARFPNRTQNYIAVQETFLNRMSFDTPENTDKPQAGEAFCEATPVFSQKRHSAATTDHDPYGLGRLHRRLQALRTALQRQEYERTVFENRLFEHRINAWIAVLTLLTLKSLDTYIQVRRRLRDSQIYPGRYGIQCVRCGASAPHRIRMSQLDPTQSPKKHSVENAEKTQFPVPRLHDGYTKLRFSRESLDSAAYCSNCATHFDVHSADRRRRISSLEFSLDGLTFDSVSRGSVRRSSVGRLSLLSFVSLEDGSGPGSGPGVALDSDVSLSAQQCMLRNSTFLRGPLQTESHEEAEALPAAISPCVKEKIPSHFAGLSSLCVPQRHRRRRTTLGYTMRLQKPK